MAPTAAEKAESLFDTLGARYEDAFADDPILCKFVKDIAEKLPPKSKVLDVGCGTGKPVSYLLAQGGHTVHGIDVSGEMARLAGKQVPGGVFQQADMREYHPQVEMDAVFAVLSLFQLTPGDLVSMMYKFAEWVRMDGLVALCVLPSTALAPDKVVYDPTWDAVWMPEKEWMGSVTNESFFSEDGWTRILKEAGFVLEAEPVSYLFSPIGENHIPEAHYCLVARRVEKEPLLGPFPWQSLPDSGSLAFSGTEGGIMQSQRLMSEDFGRLITGLDQQDAFALGTKSQGYWISGSPVKSPYGYRAWSFAHECHSLSSISSGTIQKMIVPWALNASTEIHNALSEAVEMTQSQIIILQGAPDNEATRLINSVARSRPLAHQGKLLDSAQEYLSRCGFGQFSLKRVRAIFSFPEPDISGRCDVAADFLISLWHHNHPQRKEMTDIIRSRLHLLFKGHEHSIGFNMVALIASRLPK